MTASLFVVICLLLGKALLLLTGLSVNILLLVWLLRPRPHWPVLIEPQLRPLRYFIAASLVGVLLWSIGPIYELALQAGYAYTAIVSPAETEE
jgi:hypothetical protein